MDAAGMKHTPWDGSHPLFRIGLATLDLADWIEPDERLAQYLSEKEQLLAGRRDTVLAAEAGTEAAQAEVRDVLVDHLTTRFPAIWQRQGDSIRIVPAGRSVALGEDLPIAAAARLVQEDLVLMRRGPEGWRLSAACLCFPSSWRLADKFGKTLDHVHGPVPEFGPGSRNAMVMARIFDNLQPEQSVWRLNWSLYPDDRLFHGDHSTETRRSGDLFATFLRVEYQTLRKMKASGDILFTIRIHVDPAAAILRHPERQRLASGLRDLILKLDPAQLEYKGLTAVRDRLAGQLETVAKG
jgi:hypothetical protein